MKWFTRFVRENKLYGIDSRDSLQDIIVLLVVLVWILAAVVAILTHEPIDSGISLIAGSVLGAYYGPNLLKKKK
jgi:hypothetical protein